MSSFKSKAIGHDLLETNAQVHFDQLHAKLATIVKWKLDTAKKLELMRDRGAIANTF